MGCCCCCFQMSQTKKLRLKAQEFELENSQMTELVEIMNFLGLTWSEVLIDINNTVDRIHSSFCMLDLDTGSTIDREELLEGLGAHQTKFAMEAFRVFDRNNDGGLDFVEFLIATIKLCCSNPENLCRFAFRLVDRDNSGEIETEELERLVHIVYGDEVGNGKKDKNGKKKKQKPSKFKIHTVEKIFTELDVNQSGAISIEEFVHVVSKFPQIIEPAFHLRDLVRRKVVNKTFWQGRENKFRSKFNKAEHGGKKQLTSQVKNYADKYGETKIVAGENLASIYSRGTSEKKTSFKQKKGGGGIRSIQVTPHANIIEF